MILRVVCFAVAVVVSSVCALVSGCEARGPALPAVGPGAAAVTVKTIPAGATVVVDGVAVGPSPVTVTLNPGPHRLRATMSGYYPTQETKIVVERSVPTTHTLALVASH